MEERPVLVVLNSVVNLLIPDHSPMGRRYVHKLDEEGIPDQVVGEHSGSLQARVGPSSAVRVGNIEPGDGDCLDLVRCFWYCPFDYFLVGLRQYRRHSGSFQRVLRSPAGTDGKWACADGEMLQVTVAALRSYFVGDWAVKES